MSILTFPLLQTTPSATGSMLTTFIPFGIVILIFYFLIIRPQNKKQKDTEKMLAAIKKGDKVVTIGGVHGVIQAVKESTVIVKIDESAKIEVNRSAIASVMDPNQIQKTDKLDKAGNPVKAGKKAEVEQAIAGNQAADEAEKQ